MLLRRNGEYHHGDVLGNKGVITDGSGNVLSSNEGDSAVRSTVGLEEDLDFSGPPVTCPLYVNRALALSDKPCGGKPPRKHPPQPKPPDCSKFNYIWKTPNNNTVLIAYGPCSLAQRQECSDTCHKHGKKLVYCCGPKVDPVKGQDQRGGTWFYYPPLHCFCSP